MEPTQKFIKAIAVENYSAAKQSLQSSVQQILAQRVEEAKEKVREQLSARK